MKGNDDFEVIVAGDVEGSILYEVITPPDDDMIMPLKAIRFQNRLIYSEDGS